MTIKDLGRLLLSWRRFPPAPVALEGIRRMFAAVHDIKIDDDRTSESAPKPHRATREDVAQMAAVMNGVMVGHG